MTRRSWALFAAMCVLWGLPYLLIRVAVRDFLPGTLVFARTAIGGLVLLPFALAHGGFGPVLRRWRPLLAFTVIELAVPWLLLSDAERKLSSSLSGLLVAAVPLVGAVVARVAGSDDRGGGWLRYAGLLVGLAGLVVLVGLDVGQVRAGALVELAVVVVGYAVAPVIMARRLADLPSIPVVAASLLITALGYLPYAVVRWPSSVSAKAAWSVVGLGIVCTALAFVVFFALITAIGPARATVITYVNPAVAVLLGVLLLDEQFTLGIAVGFPLILIGSVLAARHEAREPDAATSGAAGPEALAAELVAGPSAGDASADTAGSGAAGSRAAQSMRISPLGVSNIAATTPVSPSKGESHSTSSPSSGCRAEVPK
jgi:drug/metabolite transporter (DMT)-like permease